MRYFFTVFLMLAAMALAVRSQECPDNWLRFTTSAYFYSCQHDVDSRDVGSAEMRQRLLREANADLARRFSMRVSDHAAIDKRAVNGRSSTTYNALTQFSTDVTLRLVETHSAFDSTTGEGWAIAYINKAKARRYYLAEYGHAMMRIHTAIDNAMTYVEHGHKVRARNKELRPLAVEFEKAGDAIAWLAFFEQEDIHLDSLAADCYAARRLADSLLVELEQGPSVYVGCVSAAFTSFYPLKGEVERSLSEQVGCRFVASPEEADWLVDIHAIARKHAEWQADDVAMYVAYVDASLSIVNMASRHKVYSESITSDKGKATTHSGGLVGAANSAYRTIVPDIVRAVVATIQQ